MVDSINGVNYSSKISGINSVPRQKEPDKVALQSKNEQVVELQPAINHAIVKTPMPYVKTGEIKLPYDLTAECYKLANGQRVVIVPKDGETVLKTYVNTGSMNETDKIRGISHYIEHNLFNGSDGLEAGEFFRTTDKMGAETNASTGLAETNYFIASHLLSDGDLEKKIKIHSSMLESPRFAADMLEKEKGIVNSEINMITSNPDNIAYNKTLKNLFNIQTSSNDVIAGRTDNITNLTRDDVVKYFDTNYYPANMVTVVTGEVNPDETMRLISKYFSSNKKPPVSRHYEQLVPITSSKREDILSDKTDTTFVTVGFAGPENNNSKDRIYAEAASRLMFSTSSANALFDKLNTSVYSMSEKVSVKPSDKRALMLTSDVSEDNSEKLLKAIYARISKYQNNLPTADEMKMIKRNLKSDYAKMFEYSSALNNWIGESILENSYLSLTDYNKIVDEMTPQDVTNAARKYYDLNKTAITVLHPANTNEGKIQENYANTKNVSFTGAVKKQAYDINDVKQYNLANNFRVVTHESKYPIAEISLDIGPMEPVKVKNPAATRVLCDMLSQGSMNMDKNTMDAIKDENNLILNFAANRGGISAIGEFDFADSEKAINLMKDVIQNPRLLPEEFEKVKANLRDDLLRTEKGPYNKLMPNLFKDAYYTKEDILKGLDTLTLDDVKALYADLLKNACGDVVFSAPFKENPNLKNTSLSQLNSFSPVKPYKYSRYENYAPQTESKVFTEEWNKSQAKIVMAYKFKDVGNLKDQVTVELLNTILGGGPTSRLFNDLREKQKLAYSVRSTLDNKGTTSAIELVIGTTTDDKDSGAVSYDNLQKSINGFKAHVEKLKNEKVSEEELKSAKLSLKTLILSSCESTSGKNGSILSGLESYYGVNKENQYLDMIDKITVDDIYNAAQTVFGGKPLYSVAATKNTLDYNKEYLNNLLNG